MQIIPDSQKLMDPNHLNHLIAIERSYWWHIAKRMMVTEILKRYFPPPATLLEGGFGAGWNLIAFKELGYHVTGFDLLPEAVKHCGDIGIHDVAVHDLREPWPVDSESIGVVVMLDVIEHFSNPAEVLKNAAATIQNEGGIVVTVPALNYLMGPWDHLLGHFRRYSIGHFRKLARESGLQVLWVSYWNTFSLPVAVIARSMEKLFCLRHSTKFPHVSPWINALLVRCAKIERSLMFKVPIPYGLSLIGVLIK